MEKIKLMPLIYALLGLSEKIGQPIEKLLKALQNTTDDYRSFSESIMINEQSDIEKFLHAIEEKKGSAYEMDSTSRLIFDLVSRIKANKKLSKSVLIIDDLDRLDPEHIFRLFNIFSTHYDQITEENKFGFDKVIFVCDIENIRKIFHHRYGLEVDFSGYIDKFYSVTPFDFDNRKYVKEKVDHFIKKIYLDESLYTYNFNDNKRFFYSVKAIIISLLDAKVINLRMLQQYNKLKIPNFYYGKESTSSISTPIIVLFHLLKNFYGSFEILYEKLQQLFKSFDKETITTNTHPEYNMRIDEASHNIISFCLPFILPEEELMDRYEDNKIVYSEILKCTIHFNIIRNAYIKFTNFSKATESNLPDGKTIILNPYELMLYVFEQCRKKALI